MATMASKLEMGCCCARSQPPFELVWGSLYFHRWPRNIYIDGNLRCYSSLKNPVIVIPPLWLHSLVAEVGR